MSVRTLCSFLTVLLCKLFHLVLAKSLGGMAFYSLFLDKETKALVSEVTQVHTFGSKVMYSFPYLCTHWVLSWVS